jgi:4-amino-4-deoxy-L-arabinose transferase-like glycosyltransferase
MPKKFTLNLQKIKIKIKSNKSNEKKLKKKFKITKITKYSVDAILLTILLTAFVVRIIWVGDYFGQDEVYYVGYARDLITGRPFTSVFPPGFYYFLAPFVAVFGDAERPMHMFMVLLGTLNVGLVYLIGKKFINRWVGVVAALLLTFNTTHWFFSDFAMLDMPVTLFMTLAIYFYWNG